MTKLKVEDLEKLGCTNVKLYTLVNNYGFTFVKNGIKYDARFWENFYGVPLNQWSVGPYFPFTDEGLIESIKKL